MGQPFRIEVSDSTLDDLRDRVRRARFTTASSSERWAVGVDPEWLKQLASYWADGFDWRATEAALNSVPHYFAEIAGTRMHYIVIPAETQPALPIILNHGWPSSFVEMLALADRLAHPSRFGAADGTAYDVVVPSLPGFLYSALPDSPLTRAAIAELLHGLMVDELGFERYAIFGGDIGGVSGAWMAASHPENVVGIVQIHPSFPSSFDEPPITVEEQVFLDAEDAYDATDGGYSAIMGTRPDTIAAALADSPVGLLAWIVDKYRDWSDCDGNVESRFDRDTLLAIATLYWATGSIGSSFRQYVDFEHNHDRGLVTVPAAFTLSCEISMTGFPRSIAERAYTDIRVWNTPGRGGHFLAHEEPQLAASEIRAFLALLETA